MASLQTNGVWWFFQIKLSVLFDQKLKEAELILICFVFPIRWYWDKSMKEKLLKRIIMDANNKPFLIAIAEIALMLFDTESQKWTGEFDPNLVFCGSFRPKSVVSFNWTGYLIFGFRFIYKQHFIFHLMALEISKMNWRIWSKHYWITPKRIHLTPTN